LPLFLSLIEPSLERIPLTSHKVSIFLGNLRLFLGLIEPSLERIPLANHKVGISLSGQQICHDIL
jgi:hypothetical protein